MARYLRLIALTTTVAVAAAIGFTLLQPNVYEAEMQLAVSKGDHVIAPDLGNEFQALTSTVSQLLPTNIVAEGAIKQLNAKRSPQTLLEHLDIAVKPDSAVISVTYKSEVPADAVNTLSQVGKVFKTLIDQKISAGELGEPTPKTTTADSGDPSPQPVTVTVFDPAHLLPEKASPHPARNVAVALVLGIMIGAFVAAFLESTTRRKEEQELPRKENKASS